MHDFGRYGLIAPRIAYLCEMFWTRMDHWTIGPMLNWSRTTILSSLIAYPFRTCDSLSQRRYKTCKVQTQKLILIYLPRNAGKNSLCRLALACVCHAQYLLVSSKLIFDSICSSSSEFLFSLLLLLSLGKYWIDCECWYNRLENGLNTVNGMWADILTHMLQFSECK